MALLRTDGASPEHAGLLSAELAAGSSGGYSFRYVIVPARAGTDDSDRDKAAGFALAATPIEYGKDGRRSFYLDSNGDITRRRQARRGCHGRGSTNSGTTPSIELLINFLLVAIKPPKHNWYTLPYCRSGTRNRLGMRSLSRIRGPGWKRATRTQRKRHRRAEAATKTSDQGGQSLPSGAERRRQVRYVVSATALVIESTSRTRLTGRASDLGLAGCYVDVIEPVPRRLFRAFAAHRRRTQLRVRGARGLLHAGHGNGAGLYQGGEGAGRGTARMGGCTASWHGRCLQGAIEHSAPEHGFDREQSAAASKADASLDALHELVALLLRKGVLDESEAASLRRKLTR